MPCESLATENCQMPMKNINNTLNNSEKISQKKDYARIRRQNESAQQKAERLAKQRAYALA